jgi:hypothetical protein
MDYEPWFRNQLQATGDLLIWAFQQLPPGRQFQQPPESLGNWPAIRHIFHMYHNEQEIVLPRLWQWRGGAKPTVLNNNKEADWNTFDKRSDSQAIIDLFQSTRAEHIKLISAVPESLWEETRETTIGPVTLAWVVSKSLQHTSDHINQLLRLALFWDRVAAGSKKENRAKN